MSESDKEFVERMDAVLQTGTRGSFEDFDRLLALAHRGAAMQWRPISEAPRDGTRILITNKTPFVSRYQYGVWDVDGGQVYNATHWMPLPPPPEGEKE